MLFFIIFMGKFCVIFGLMIFGLDEEIGVRIIDVGEYNCVLDLLQSRGYNEVDIVRLYIGGKQEVFIVEMNW